MAYSKCSKCDNTSFEVKENSPAHSNYKLIFVQCSRCGSVVGVMDYMNIGSRIADLEKQIKVIKSSDNSFSNALAVINENITRLFNLIKSNR